jgi:hypothetical protein
MADPLDLARERLERLLGLAPAQAQRAVTETLDCLGQGVDEYISERHRELQSRGVRNPAIYETIARELGTPVVRQRRSRATNKQVAKRERERCAASLGISVSARRGK